MNRIFRIAHSDGRSWFDFLTHAEMAMKCAPIAHSDCYHFMLNHGHDPCLIADVFDQVPHETVDTEEPFIFMERMKTDLKAGRSDRVVQANKRRIPYTIEVGDQVLVDVQITKCAL